MIFPLYFWLLFITFIIIAIIIDLTLSNERVRPHYMMMLWVTSAMIFSAFIYSHAGKQKFMEFVTGYIMELTLSVDNVFVFLLIFMYLKIPSVYQHRILFWGVVSAIFMRLAMVLGGIYLVSKLKWIFYVFGAILIVSAFKIFFINMNATSLGNKSNGLINLLKRFISITDNQHAGKFISMERGKRVATPSLIALLLIEKTDLIFALDSIPAILALTQDSFIIFTSNIFAILGLRSMYFALEKVVYKFRFMKQGIAIILALVGIKMILAMQGYHISVEASLFTILSILTASIILSIIKPA